MQVLPAVKRQPTFKERLGETIGQGLRVGAQSFIKGMAQKKQQQQLSEYFTNLQEQHPNDEKYQLFADVFKSPLPMDQKMQFLKNLSGMGDPYRSGQQERLQTDSVLRKYGSRIKEIDTALKGGTYSSYGEKEELQELKKALQQERDQLLNFSALGGDQEDSDSFEEDQEDQVIAPKKTQKKAKFDYSNPKHKARAELVLKKTRGDKKKAAQVLAREFD